jgi:hypothetical protein
MGEMAGGGRWEIRLVLKFRGESKVNRRVRSATGLKKDRVSHDRGLQVCDLGLGLDREDHIHFAEHPEIIICFVFLSELSQGLHSTHFRTRSRLP